jgi:type IV secretory pathway VirJ component
MTKAIKRILFTLFLLLFARGLHAATYPAEGIGTIHLYGKPNASSVIVLVSGKAGWTQKMDQLAAHLAEKGQLVGGLDFQEYLNQVKKAKLCPASDLDKFGKQLQKRAGTKEYRHVILVGYREGGSIVMLAQAESPGIFAGAASIGFCPQLPVPAEETCGGDKLYQTNGAWKMGAPWIVFQGVGEPCKDEETRIFLQRVPDARVVRAEADWIPQLENEIAALPQTANRLNIGGLPIVEYTAGVENPTLAIYFSGDGGWGEMEDEMSAYYQKKGVASVGVDSLRYFWHVHDPIDAGKDLGNIIHEYTARWKKSDVILIGYSYGADVLPFLVNRLPQDALNKVRGVALIGPSRTIDFDVSPALEDRPPELPLMPEIKKIHSAQLLCIGGNLENQSLCRRLSEKTIVASADVEILRGGHAFGWQYQKIADLILQKLTRHS